MGRKGKNKNRSKKNIRKVKERLGTQYVTKNKSHLRTIRIRHREYIADIETDDTGNYRNWWYVNPGLSNVFPWLSGIAGNFETYVFHKLNFIYNPSVGSAWKGFCAICPDYDADDANSNLDKGQLFAFEDTLRTPSWQTATMVCSPKNLKKRKTYYTRKFTSNLDLKDQDVCKITVLGYTNVNTLMGELWVEYDIELQTPQVPDVDGDVTAFTTTATATSPFRDDSQPGGLIQFIGDIAGLNVKSATQINITEPGYYIFDTSWTGTSLGGAVSWAKGTLGTVLRSTFGTASTQTKASQTAVVWAPPETTTLNPVELYNTGTTTGTVTDVLTAVSKVGAELIASLM